MSLSPPARIPPLSLQSPPPSSVCADTVTLSHFAHTRARPLSLSLSPARSPSPSCSAVSFTSVRHPRTDSNLEQEGGGAGLDIYIQEQATSYTETGNPLAVQRPTSKKTPKPGVEVPTFESWSREREQTELRDFLTCFASTDCLCWSSTTTKP